VAAILPIPSFPLGFGFASHSVFQENNLYGWCIVTALLKGPAILTLIAELEISIMGKVL
jgi:hypothetical protein